MSESDEEITKKKEITLFEIYSDENNQVYQIVSKSCMKSRISLIKQQYIQFFERKRM